MSNTLFSIVGKHRDEIMIMVVMTDNDSSLLSICHRSGSERLIIVVSSGSERRIKS